MSNCPDFCSAAKCRELSDRLEVVEQDLALLRASFDSHVQQDIPQAHEYRPLVNVEAAITGNTLAIDVSVEDESDTATVDLPDDDVTVSLAANSADNTLKVFVKVGNKSDDETVTLPEPEVDVSLAANSNDNTLKVFVKVGNKNDDETVTLPEPRVNVEADIFDGTLAIDVTVGNESDIATVTLPKEDPFDWLDYLLDLLKTLLLKDLLDSVKDLIKDAIDKAIEELFDTLKDYLDDLLRATFLNVSADYSDQNLRICVSNSLGSDCASVRIPRRISGGGGGGGEEEETQDFLTGFGNLSNEGILQISINSSIGSANIQIDMGLAELERLIEEIHEYTVVDIAGKTPTAFICPKTEEETEAETEQTKPTLLPYTGKGLIGIHELTKTFNDNLLSIFTNTCQKEELIAAIPDWWQVRAGSDRPQLVVIYKGGSNSFWSLSIPWYKGNYKDKIIESIPSYTKGSFATILTLNDNSKVVVNAISKAEGETFMAKIRGCISSSQLDKAELKSGGERKGRELKKIKVTPAYAKFFPKGQKDLLPEWSYNFKTKKFFKYEREED